MSKQPNLFSFFTKSPAGNKAARQETPNKHVKLKGNACGCLDLVWAKLDGYPWWPALVCQSPGGKGFISKSKIHVQFFDSPPSRAWVNDSQVRAFCKPGDNGIPTYKDPAWQRAVVEAQGAEQLPKEDRTLILVDMQPSDDDDEAMNTSDEDLHDSDRSKENVDCNVGSNKRAGKTGEEPNKKRRRIVVESDSGSEDEYKPGVDAAESEDESVSSGVAEHEVSEPEPESEVDSPVKIQPEKKPKSTPAARNLAKVMPSPSVPRSPSTPKISEGTKSKLALFAAKETPAATTESKEDWPFLKYPWLQPNNVRDRERHAPDHPEYDKRTLYVPDSFLQQQTPGMRQWWEIKSRHYDTVIFFKMGKFYELFHMDAVMGVQELGLIMMKGDNAHVGFPEIAYGRYSTSLIEKGYKVARVEQTETPDMMEKRCKNMMRPSKFDRVVRREVCQVSSRGTRVYGVQDGQASHDTASYLLALTERPVRGAGEGSEFGVAFIDTSIGTFHVGQFVDDRYASRLHTLMAHHPVSQVLIERGRLSQKTQRLVNSVVPNNLKEVLVPEKEFWTASKTLSFLAEGSYFRNEGESSSVHWPEELKKMIDDGGSLGTTPRPDCELGLSALGGMVWYLMTCLLEEELLTRRKVEAYSPPDQMAQLDGKQSDPLSGKRHMVLDGVTLRNLEIFENNVGGTEGTLMERLDRCSTPFGKRLLRSWICAPLCSPESIKSRLDAIADLQQHPDVAEQVQALLKTLPDLQRILSRIHSQGLKRKADHPDNRAIYFEEIKYNKKKVLDFIAVLKGFETCIDILNAFNPARDLLQSSLLKKCVTSTEKGGGFPSLAEPLKFFENAFDQAEAQKEGKILPRSGVDPEYDAALDQINNTKQELADYLKQQARHFGTKVVYWGNDKKRYQLEVPESACGRAGDDYELVSQKKGHRRFWTATTKQLLAQMTAGEEQRNTALADIARRIFHQFDQHHKVWEGALQCVSVLDVLLSLTRYSQEVSTVRPDVLPSQSHTQPLLEIRDGLHPCVVTTFSGDEFIPNDMVMGGDSTDANQPLILVTGPNMGGKSTLMRQTALLCIIAQLGCHVPAAGCRMTPVDRVFTRLGASDRIMLGESTFYVELAETCSIIQHATQHSLVLVDELGRGTATYDGMAIASGVVEALVGLKCRTLFSTHYHGLVEQFSSNPHISLGHMACMVEGENEEDPSQESITFLYKFIEGACPKSYGFNAARLAGLPDHLIRLASRKAKELEIKNKKKQMFISIDSHRQNLKLQCLQETVEKLKNIL